MKTPPTSWLDLFDPEYAGKYAIGDISGTSGWQFLLALNKLKGGTLDNIDARASRPSSRSPKGSTVLYTQADQVVSLFERGRSRSPPGIRTAPASPSTRACSLAVAYPQGRRGRHPAGCGHPQGHGRRRELALKFIDQVLSAEGQTCFSEARLSSARSTPR